MLSKIKGIISSRMFRFRYAQTKRNGLSIASPPLWHLPSGFSVQHLADTGLLMMDNFCTRDEAKKIIDVYRDQVKRSTVIHENNESVVHSYRTSSDIFIPLKDIFVPPEKSNHSILKELVYRSSSLLGLPLDYVEQVSVSRYRTGEYYKSHYDHDGSIKADRLYTVLVYLNDMADGEGGGTIFPDLNVIAQPVCGRAVCWVNSDLDKSVRRETRHAALPVLKDGAEKWILQLWLRGYKCSKVLKPMMYEGMPAGVPLQGDESLPAGFVASVDTDEKALFPADDTDAGSC